MPRTLQYQVTVEPISTRPETVTVDKFQGSQEVPLRAWAARRDAAAIVQASATFFDFTPFQFKENVTVDRWHPNIEQPRFDVKRLQYLDENFFFRDGTRGEVIRPDKWYPCEEVPRFDIKREQWKYPSLFYADIPRKETVTVDRWLFELPDPIRRRPNPIVDGFSFLYPITPVVTTPFDWMAQHPGPQPVKPRPVPDGFSFLSPFASTPFDWQAQRPDPQRPKPRPSPESFFFNPTPVVSLDWLVQNVTPANRVSRRPDGVSAFVQTPTEVVTVDKWGPQYPYPYVKADWRDRSCIALVQLVQPSFVPPDSWIPAQVYIKPPAWSPYWMQYEAFVDFTVPTPVIVIRPRGSMRNAYPRGSMRFGGPSGTVD